MPKYQAGNLLSVFLILLVLSSCSVKKYIPENEHLYIGAEVESIYPEEEKKDKPLNLALDKAVIPTPNSSFLGMRIGLWAYFKTESGKSGFISRFINKKYGEKPVYLSDVDPEDTEELLENRLLNRGYFHPEISSATNIKKHKANINYKVQTGTPYRLESYYYQSDSITPIDSMINTALRQTSITPGTKFNIGLLKKERSRIEKYLKEQGYYYFNANYLLFKTDTNNYSHRAYNLILTLKEDVSRDKLIPYRLGQVSVISGLGANPKTNTPDSLIYRDILYKQYPEWVKPRFIDKQVISVPDSLYRLSYAQSTARRLSSLGAYQHANIQFMEVSDSGDVTGILDAKIYLTPARKYSVRTGTNVYTKSTGFAGPGLNLTIQNRNLFKGAEVLEIQGVIGYEFQISRGSSRGLQNFEFKLDNSLTFPRLIAPIIKFNPFKAYSVPNTKLSLNFNFQQRALYYSLNNFYSSLGYDWFSNAKVRWQITPMSLNYMHVFNRTDEFNEIIDGNPFLARSLTDQFIPANSITFRYSEMNDATKANQFFISWTLEQAGFLMGSLSSNDTLLGLPFAQYVKSDIDIRHNFRLSKEHRIVNRIFLGIGHPYGNSASLPYVRQYFAGGPNSVRAFLVRSLGPGGFVPEAINNTTFFDQAGDIRIEFNSEYRFPILGYLKGAIFVDAGNIWLANNNPSLPNGQFTSDWYKQLGIGTGLGFRFDAQVLVVRLDLSHAIAYPSKEYKEFWLADKRLGGLVWNFAIGYPF